MGGGRRGFSLRIGQHKRRKEYFETILFGKICRKAAGNFVTGERGKKEGKQDLIIQSAQKKGEEKRNFSQTMPIWFRGDAEV